MLIDDIEYAVFRHLDLATLRQFMLDHGLLDAGQMGNTLELRSRSAGEIRCPFRVGSLIETCDE